MALDTFTVPQGSNLFDTLKKKFPWKADWQIWNQIIPDVMEKNKGVLNDPNQVSPNVTYLVSGIEKPMDKYPDEPYTDFAPANVAGMASDQIAEAKRLGMLEDAQWAAEMNADRALTDKVGGLYSAFTGKRYTSSALAKPSDSPFSKTRDSADAKKIEQEDIWRRYQALLKEGKEPRSKGAFEAWINSINPSSDGAKYIFDQIADNYDWGNWKLLRKLDPDDPLAVPISIYRQENSPEFYEAIRMGFSTGDLAADRAAAKRQASIGAIRALNIAMGGTPTESKFREYYNKQTDPVVLAALENWAEQQGFDSPGAVFIDENNQHVWAKRGTKEYEAHVKAGRRRASLAEWANVNYAEQRQKLLQRVEDKYNNWKIKMPDTAYLSPATVQKWVMAAFRDDLHLIDSTNSITNIAEQWMAGLGGVARNENIYATTETTLQGLFDSEVEDYDQFVKIINDTTLPETGDNSKKTLLDKWKNILDTKFGWEPQPAVMYMDGVAIEGTRLGRITRNGDTEYKDEAPFMTEDTRYAVKKGKPRREDEIVFSPAEARDFTLKEIPLVWDAAQKVRQTQGFNKIEEGYRDVHQRYYGIRNNLITMAEQPEGKRAWGAFDQQIADMWKKLTDESMITSEEFRTILRGSSYLQELRTYFGRKFSEDETGSFLTPEQRTAILMMTRKALVYKQEQAQAFFNSLEGQWKDNKYEISGYKKATAPIVELINTELEPFDVEAAEYQAALNTSPIRDSADVVEEVTTKVEKGDWIAEVIIGDPQDMSTWKIETPTGEFVTLDLNNPEHRKWYNLDPL